jgi:hypothetical protein
MFDTTTIIAGVAVIMVLIVLYMKFFVNKKGSDGTTGGIGSLWTAGTGPGVAAGAKKPGMWTVYGSDGCGWTLKQIAVLDGKGIPYNYVNCDKDKAACQGMTAFPTLVSPEGVKTVGFNGMA